jgi:hypothetical protein
MQKVSFSILVIICFLSIFSCSPKINTEEKKEIGVEKTWSFEGCQITKIKIEMESDPIFIAKCDGIATQTITKNERVSNGKTTTTRQKTTITTNTFMDGLEQKCLDLENSKVKALEKLTKEEKEILGLK